jgi:succinate dehydrogenase / fumarate reductase membrane anchor subunit
MTSFQTPITPVKGQGPANMGVAHWRWQRISGAALIPSSIWFLIEMLRHTQADYHAVVAWVAQPWVSGTLALFVGVVFYHGALGLQVVIEDYIPNPFWQKALIIKVKTLSLLMAALSWFFIIRIAITANG